MNSTTNWLFLALSNIVFMIILWQFAFVKQKPQEKVKSHLFSMKHADFVHIYGITWRLIIVFCLQHQDKLDYLLLCFSYTWSLLSQWLGGWLLYFCFVWCCLHGRIFITLFKLWWLDCAITFLLIPTINFLVLAFQESYNNSQTFQW